MCEERSAKLLLMILSIVLLVLPRPSLAQLDEIWLVGTDVELIQGPGNIRLAGMGNLTIAIEDENNEVNLYDFTGNVASLILDKDTNNTDAWGSYGKWVDEKEGVRYQDVGIWDGGALVVLRDEDTYAGGASFSTRVLDLSRVDDEYFRSILRVNFPKGEAAPSETSLVCTEVTSNAVEGHYAHRLSGMLLVGVRGWGRFGGDKKPVAFSYDFTSSENDIGAGLGLVFTPLEWVQIGGSLDLGSRVTETSSKDAFHDDLYRTDRSILTVSSHALLEFMGHLRGVMNYRHFSFDADQTLRMNWSDLYVLNPEEIDIRQKLKISSDVCEYDFFASRWILSGLGLPLTVSGYFDMAVEESWQHALPNVLVWTDGYDQVLEEWNLGGGASYQIGGMGVVGMELRFNRGRLENRLPLEEGYRNFRALDLRGGGEFRVLKCLALRGGYSRCNEERSIGIAEDDFTATTFSVGAGYYLKDNRLSLDAAFVNKTTEPDLGVDRETRHQTLMLYGRFLF